MELILFNKDNLIQLAFLSKFLGIDQSFRIGDTEYFRTSNYHACLHSDVLVNDQNQGIGVLINDDEISDSFKNDFLKAKNVTYNSNEQGYEILFVESSTSKFDYVQAVGAEVFSSPNGLALTIPDYHKCWHPSAATCSANAFPN